MFGSKMRRDGYAGELEMVAASDPAIVAAVREKLTAETLFLASLRHAPVTDPMVLEELRVSFLKGYAQRGR